MSAAPATTPAVSLSSDSLAGERLRERIFELLMLLALLMALGFLVILLYDIITSALPVLQDRGGSFLTEKLSNRISRTGLSQALVGSLQIAMMTAAVAFPLGVATAIYLEEYTDGTWFTRMVDINVRNLAGVPSIVYGLLGFAIFVRFLQPLTGGRTALSAGLTMGLLALPIVVITAAESIRAVPITLREGGYGLGATRWQVTRRLVLPSAAPGMLTGMILALARAIGETAPLLVVGAATFLTTEAAVTAFREPFTALPVVVFQWAKVPRREFVEQAAPAAILVLLVFTLSMNGLAIWLRNRYEKRSA